MEKVTMRSPARASLSEMLDRLLDKGVVVAGDVVLSVANIDLVYCELRLLLTSMDRYEEIKKQRHDPSNRYMRTGLPAPE